MEVCHTTSLINDVFSKTCSAWINGYKPDLVATAMPALSLNISMASKRCFRTIEEQQAEEAHEATHFQVFKGIKDARLDVIGVKSAGESEAITGFLPPSFPGALVNPIE